MSIAPHIIIAARNGSQIALANPSAVVIDLGSVAFHRGDIRVAGSTSGKSTYEFKISAMLCAAAGNLVEYYEIVDGIWGGHECGGPIDPLNIIRQYLPSIRRRLQCVGLDISLRWGLGLVVVPLAPMYLQAAE